MYAIKRRAIIEGVYPKKFPVPALAREFFHSVEKDGRQSEGRLLANLYMKTNPFAALKQMGLGMKLFFQGRIGIGKESIRRKEELHKLLAALENGKTTQKAKAPGFTTMEAL